LAGANEVHGWPPAAPESKVTEYGSPSVAFSMYALRMKSSGLIVKELVNLLLVSVLAVAAGVETLGVSVAVTLGLKGPAAVRAFAAAEHVKLLGFGSDGVQVKPIPVRTLYVNVSPPKPPEAP
jgi:hypothetical protein